MVFMGSCGGDGGGGGEVTSTPERTLSEFSSSVKSGDISGALENVSQDSQERLQAALEKLDDASRQKLADAVLNATKISESENMIVYKGTMTLPDGQTVEDTFELVLENGAWKLSGL